MDDFGSEGGRVKNKLNLDFIKDHTALDQFPIAFQRLRSNPGRAIEKLFILI
ncbi:MAG: hypothetical protein KJ559_01180 [Nanoarchaeota archaeon]|nr:hypothetical protein [Nanoarchaeota archaeon]